MSPVELIENGIKELQGRSHHKNWYVSDDGESVCMIGSLMIACGGNVVVSEKQPHLPYNAWIENYYAANGDALDNAELILDEYAKFLGHPSAPGFNDLPETSKEDVILFMKQAIDYASE